MGAPRSYTSSYTSSAPRSPTKVKFQADPVSGSSRQLTNNELWTLYYFEQHAAECSYCYDPLVVANEGARLCSEGNDCATEVSALLFRRSDGNIYAREKDVEGKEIHVEMPVDYFQCTQLLHAIQRCLKKGEKFLKTEAHRTSSRRVSARKVDEPRISARRVLPTPVEPRPHYDVKVVQPRQPHTLHPEYLAPKKKRTSPRGSLYDVDMEEAEQRYQQEMTLNYNVEVREPANASRRRGPTYSYS